MRGPRRHFTHSKVMAWVAVDRAVRTSRNSASRVRSSAGATLRDTHPRRGVHPGVQPEVGAFTQYYGSDALDASLLMIPLVGFLPATDARVGRPSR